MPYSTKADIQKEISDEELIGLTDDESAGIINDARVTEAIADADSLIDSYCGQVVAVPFATVPPVIKKHSKTIAIYNLYSRRSAIPETRKKNFDDAIAHLKDIAKGLAALTPVTEAEVSAEPQTDRTQNDRKFTMGKKSNGSTGSLDNY